MTGKGIVFPAVRAIFPGCFSLSPSGTQSGFSGEKWPDRVVPGAGGVKDACSGRDA
jgi:hypothetical protein